VNTRSIEVIGRNLTRAVEVMASEPQRIQIPAGEHSCVTLRCSNDGRHGEMVVFPSLGRLVTLPAHADVVVELPPLRPGEYDFYFANGAPCGTLVVAAAAG
jgi:Cupredoxin-like domain